MSARILYEYMGKKVCSKRDEDCIKKFLLVHREIKTHMISFTRISSNFCGNFMEDRFLHDFAC
jgi:hypothetical protein